MRRITIRFVNEWKQFTQKFELNWITFTLFDFEIEKESRMGQFTISFFILGFGIQIGIIYKETDYLKELIDRACRK